MANWSTIDLGTHSMWKMALLGVTCSVSIFLVSVSAKAQVPEVDPNSSISGRVLDSDSGEPLEGTHIFLANTTLGAASDPQGYFEINRVTPGPYSLVVSMLGYATQQRDIEVLPDERIEDIVFRLSPMSYEIEGIEVAGQENRRWQKQIRVFEEHFIGRSENGKLCTILNPYVLNFEGDAVLRLTASANEPLQIENRALGYVITFVLEEFMLDGSLLRFTGKPFFQEMTPEDEEEQLNWLVQREQTYLGSLSHLLASIIRDEASEEGYELYIAGGAEKRTGLHSRDLLQATSKPYAFKLLFENALTVVYTRKLQNKRRLFDRKSVREVSLRHTDEDSGIINWDGYHYPDILTVSGALGKRRVADALPREFGLSRTSNSNP